MDANISLSRVAIGQRGENNLENQFTESLFDSCRSNICFLFLRIIWVILYVVMICGVAYVVFDVYAEYRRSPIVTTEDKDMYPTKNVAFPGTSYSMLLCFYFLSKL